MNFDLSWLVQTLKRCFSQLAKTQNSKVFQDSKTHFSMLESSLGRVRGRALDNLKYRAT